MVVNTKQYLSESRVEHSINGTAEYYPNNFNYLNNYLKINSAITIKVEIVT
jgi:hypothetical protein